MASAAKLERPGRSENDTVPFAASATPRFALRHYSVAEIAELWNLSPDAVRKIFEKEPDTLVIRDQRSSARKRRYTTLRIPEDVVERVHRRLSRV